MTNQELIMLAEQIATKAHAGQVDKNGVDYIEHPRGVAAQFDRETQAGECVVAWLHDVLEDTSVTAEDLLAAGIPAPLVAAVELLSKDPTEPTLDAYYARIAANPIALAVKAADITNNTDPARVALLDQATRDRLAAKYAAARTKLGLSQGT